MNQAFVPYFLFYWSPDPKTTECAFDGLENMTVAEILIKGSGQELSPEEIEILTSANRRPLFLYEILSTKPNHSYRIRNLFTDEEFEVTERAGSTSVGVGGIILSAIFHLNGHWQNMATAPYMLPPIDKQSVFHLRDEIRERVGRKKLTEDKLVPFVTVIRALYLDRLDTLLDPTPPTLTNTDGEPFEPQKIHFEIASAESAFFALKGLARKVLSEKDLLQDAIFENGQLRQVEIPWFKKGKASNEKTGFTVLGRARIDGTKLVVEVNSEQRGKRLREKIVNLLGKEVRYITTVRESIERQLDEQRIEESPRVEIKDAPLPTELQEHLKSIADAHWEKWMDEEVPALDGMTPREAAKTKVGRGLLKSLLLYYEQRNSSTSGNLLKPDLKDLRSKLGIK